MSATRGKEEKDGTDIPLPAFSEKNLLAAIDPPAPWTLPNNPYTVFEHQLFQTIPRDSACVEEKGKEEEEESRDTEPWIRSTYELYSNITQSKLDTSKTPLPIGLHMSFVGHWSREESRGIDDSYPDRVRSALVPQIIHTRYWVNQYSDRQLALVMDDSVAGGYDDISSSTDTFDRRKSLGGLILGRGPDIPRPKWIIVQMQNVFGKTLQDNESTHVTSKEFPLCHEGTQTLFCYVSRQEYAVVLGDVLVDYRKWDAPVDHVTMHLRTVQLSSPISVSKVTQSTVRDISMQQYLAILKRRAALDHSCKEKIALGLIEMAPSSILPKTILRYTYCIWSDSPLIRGVNQLLTHDTFKRYVRSFIQVMVPISYRRLVRRGVRTPKTYILLLDFYAYPYWDDIAHQIYRFLTSKNDLAPSSLLGTVLHAELGYQVALWAMSPCFAVSGGSDSTRTRSTFVGKLDGDDDDSSNVMNPSNLLRRCNISDTRIHTSD